MPEQARDPESASEDLDIIAPDVTIAIGGRDVTVHEYGFLQELRIRAKSHELVRDLQAAAEGAEILTDDMLDVLAKHEELVRELIVEATGEDAAFIDGLSGEDGDELLATWWSVNGPFFVRRIIRRMREAIAVKSAIDGLTSSLASPGPDMADPTGSNGTHAVN